MALSRLPQTLRFLSAGAFGTLLYYVTFAGLTELLGVEYYILSAIVASVLNFVSNFVLQKIWTFGNKEMQSIRRQAGSYAALWVALFVANVGFLYILVEYVHLWYLTAQIIVTVGLSVISYFVTKRIFRNT